MSTDPQVAHFLAGRMSSEERPPSTSVAAGHADDQERRERDRDSQGRARQARPRDRLGRPLPYGDVGVEPVPEEPLPPVETISYAHELVAEGRPFSAHEVYEARWKAGPATERELWQGLAQLCVGITHAERGNQIGARRLIGRARRRLETYAATNGPVYGLDLNHIIEWIRNRELEPGNDSWLIDHLMRPRDDLGPLSSQASRRTRRAAPASRIRGRLSRRQAGHPCRPTSHSAH